MGVIKVFNRGVAVGDAVFKTSSSSNRTAVLRYSELDNVPAGYVFIGTVFSVNGGVAKILDKTGVDLKYALDYYDDGMAANNWYRRKNGGTTNYRGLMNVERGYAYWYGNGSTPSADIPVQYSGNDIISENAFYTSPYCETLRRTYASYHSYLHSNLMVMSPQHEGCFALPDSKTLQNTYGDLTADGEYKYPAFHHCKHVDYGIDGLGEGDWFMPNVWDGVELMRDDVLAKVAPTMTKMGGAVPNNSTDRWFAQRSGRYFAWMFDGDYGVLNDYDVIRALRVQAVALLRT